ncbi:hypothetical protein [Nocardia inohanensis]|uniref:hypothetical protein n=1 Tax=Nocardia inohanensis TaxID=209246 RepID=UPI000A3DC2D1|nr:hypothetical protein [Nocardia inohanensis]
MGTVGDGMWDLVFPSGPPDRVSDMVTAAVVADAVRGVDADLAQSVETCRDWRYRHHWVFRSMTGLAVTAPEVSLEIAGEGLRSARSMLRFASGRAVTTLDALDVEAESGAGVIETGEVAGTGRAVAQLEVPWYGRVLTGEALRRQVAAWERRGIVEPAFAAAVEQVIDHPEWLRLPGFRLIALGAAAELGPLRPLLDWGAEVVAVDRPGRARWNRLLAQARSRAGRMLYPITSAGPGADIARSLPALTHWLAGRSDARPVLGMYAGLPGAGALRVAAASDVLAESLLRRHPDTALAFLGSPTDCYAVPEPVFTAARNRLAHRGFRGAAQDLLHRVAATSFYSPNYDNPVLDADANPWGLFDNLPLLSGADYALAHRLPRWRAVLARSTGTTTSYTVAPPAWTAAVHETPWRRAAYRAVSTFGVEVFDPATARPLLAAKLVADLVAPPREAPSNPEALFAEGAAHGGLWRQPFAPRSLLAPAAISGSVQEFRDRTLGLFSRAAESITTRI